MNDEGPAAPKDLRERTKRFALSVIQLFGSLSRRIEAQTIGKQLLRSGTSVGANYREAHRARSKAEFIAKIGDCLKELDETAYWLDLLAEAGFHPDSQLAGLQDECNQLLAIFTAIVKKAKASLPP